jgi:hypothetical protein
MSNTEKKTNLEHFTDHLYDIVFEETSKYLSDCVGTDDWGEELHETHGLIMYNAIKLLSKTIKTI